MNDSANIPNSPKIPKVYTSPDAADAAIKQAGLKDAGFVGGLFKMQTQDERVSFMIPHRITSTAKVAYARAFQAGIKFAQHRAADAAERAVESVPDETPDSVKIFRAYTLFKSHYVEALDDEIAMILIAMRLGYSDTEHMLSEFGQTLEEAKKKLDFKCVTYRSASEWIIRAAYASEVYEDGRHHGMFITSREWAIWHMGGETGENCQIFAQKHKLDPVSVWDAVEHSLSQRSVVDINYCWCQSPRDAA